MDYKKAFKRACWINTEHMIHRYLICCTDGREDGCERAQNHRWLCEFFEKAFDKEAEIGELHEKSQALTGYMDEKIGFPLKGWPDYDTLAPKFFEKFYKIAEQVLIKEK